MNIESDVMPIFYPYGGDFLLNEACSFAYDGEGGRVCGKHGIKALLLLCGVARVGVPRQPEGVWGRNQSAPGPEVAAAQSRLAVHGG